MSVVKAKPRQTGATAVLPRLGQPVVTSVTGGEIGVVTRPSEAGFSPLDLLYASLSACLVLSARIAASTLGVLDRLVEVRAEVKGDKAPEEPGRIERFHIEIEVVGDFDAATRAAIIAEAERICTVSNTLKGSPVLG